MQFLQRMLNSYKEMPKSRRISLIVIAALIIVISIVTYAVMNKSSYEVLYVGLSPAEAGDVYQRLVNMKVDVKTQGSGAIMVPSGSADQLRMQLAADGYPKSGLTYDLYMNNTGLGVTEYDKENYLRFQLEERLQQTIQTMDGVEQAVVTLNIPDQDTFVLESQRIDASASVMLALRYGMRLTERQIRGVEELVAKSVAGLKPENVSVVDQSMNVLNNHEEEGSEIQTISSRLDFEGQMRNQLEGQIKSLLEPVFGSKNVAVAVSLTLDYDKEFTQSVNFSPVIDDEGIKQDISELTETVNNSGTGTDQEGSEAPGYVMGDGTNADGAYAKKNTTINYLVNEIRQQIEKAPGAVVDMSVSVVINKQSSSVQTQQQVQEIVAKSIGVDPEMVVVEFLNFMAASPRPDYQVPTNATAAPKNNTLLYIVAGLLVLVVLLVALMFGMISRQRRIARERRAQREMQAQAQVQAVQQQQNADAQPVQSEEQSKAGDKPVLEDVNDVVTKEPELTVQLLRTWMAE